MNKLKLLLVVYPKFKIKDLSWLNKNVFYSKESIAKK